MEKVFLNSHYRTKIIGTTFLKKHFFSFPQVSKNIFACLGREDKHCSLSSQQKLWQCLLDRDTLQEDQLNRPLSLTLKSFGVAWITADARWRGDSSLSFLIFPWNKKTMDDWKGGKWPRTPQVPKVRFASETVVAKPVILENFSYGFFSMVDCWKETDMEKKAISMNYSFASLIFYPYAAILKWLECTKNSPLWKPEESHTISTAFVHCWASGSTSPSATCVMGDIVIENPHLCRGFLSLGWELVLPVWNFMGRMNE